MKGTAPNVYIIAVRVSPDTDIRANIPDGISSGFKRFINRSKDPTDSHNRVPGIAEIIIGSILQCNHEKEMKMLSEADYPIELDLVLLGC